MADPQIMTAAGLALCAALGIADCPGPMPTLTIMEMMQRGGYDCYAACRSEDRPCTDVVIAPERLGRAPRLYDCTPVVATSTPARQGAVFYGRLCHAAQRNAQRAP